MEVHTHSHTTRNKWTHYLWEFLMLFLAVFCGFLAEYKLEQTIERHREKEYIISMIEDLKADTANINTHANLRIDRRRRMDSLSYFLNQPDYLSHTALLYYYARWVPRATYFYSTEGTMQQLKNAGGMRLITNKSALKAIIAYDAQLKLVQTQNYSLEQDRLTGFQNLMVMIFKGNVLDEMYGDSLISKPTGNPGLISNEKRLIDQLASQLHSVKSLNNRNTYFENKLKLLAITTIEILKKEYHLPADRRTPLEE